METDVLVWMHSQLPAYTCVAVSAEDKDGDRWKSYDNRLQPFKTLVNRDGRQIYWRKDDWTKDFYGELFTYDDNYIYLHTETFPHWPKDPKNYWDARYSRFRVFVNKSIANSDFRIGRVIAPRTITKDWILRQSFDTYLCDNFDELAKSKCLPWQKDFWDTSVTIEVWDAFNTLYDGDSPAQPSDPTFREITVFDKAIVINQVMGGEDNPLEGRVRERFILVAKDGTYYGIVRWDWAELRDGEFVVTNRAVGLGIQQNASFSFDGMHQRASEDVYLPPPKPTGLKASWECGYKIVFSWNQAPGASRYDIRIDDTSDGWNPHHLSRYDAIVDGIVGTSFTFPAIPGHEYSWWLHATNDAGSSEPTGGEKVRCEVTQTPLVDCAAVLAELAALRTRLAELIANRDAETDPYRRRDLYAAVGMVENKIGVVTSRARNGGCI